MGRILLNLVLAVAVVALVLANWFLVPDPALPNWEFLPQMAHAERYNAFEANPNFADGKTLQPPPAGAIARGYMPLHYIANPLESLRAGRELVSPVAPGNQHALQRGEQVYQTFCTPCHGPAGTGNGKITQRGFPPPPSLLDGPALKMKDGHIFHIISFGQNNMKAYAGLMSREDRWNVVAYVRQLQAKTAQPPAPTPAPAAPVQTTGDKAPQTSAAGGKQ